MKEKIINIVRDFDPKPYGRYRKHSKTSGQRFREDYLAPALRENDRVHVVLDGYNRYGRSFIDEAFGSLIRESGFKKSELDEKLTYTHSLIKSVVDLIDARIEKAHQDTSGDN